MSFNINEIPIYIIVVKNNEIVILNDHCINDSLFSQLLNKRIEDIFINESWTLMNIDDNVIDCFIKKIVIGDLIYVFIESTLKCRELKNNFMANFSHEARTPTSGIIGMAALLSDTELSHEQALYLGMLKESSGNLMGLIDNILEISKLEAKKLVLINKVFYFRDLIDSVHDIVLSKATDKGILMDYIIEDSIPEFVIGDYTRIQYIFINLFTNAIKFCKNKGKVTTDIILKNINKNIITLEVSIKDSGNGSPIPVESRHLLFKSYSQLFNHFSSKTSEEGTGLGLSISRELVSLMGGKIWLKESTEENGTTFCFTLPLEFSNVNLPENDTEKLFSELKDHKILVLDDNYNNRIGISGMLLKYGMKPSPCSTSEEAILFINNNDYSVVLVDIFLPRMSGINLATKVREKHPHLPMIALSSLGERNINTNKYLFNFFLTKPVKEKKLLSAIYKCIFDNNSHSTTNCMSNLIVQSYLKILVCDDYKNNIELTRLQLNKLGYQNISTVSSGKECIDELLLSQFDYDILLIDIKMSGISGYDVMDFITESKKKSKIPIMCYCIALTAFAYSSREEFIKYGFDDALFKPYEINDLKNIIDQVNSSKLN